MADRDSRRIESADEVKSHLAEGLESCTKLLASYREVFIHDERLTRNQWKR